MALVLRSLSDFKRFLARPGATIQVVRNTFIDRQSAHARDAYRQKGMYAPRTVQALSKKAAIFALQGHPTTVWLYWDKGVRKWRFTDDLVAIPLDTGLGPPDEIVYRCSYAEGFEPEERASASHDADRCAPQAPEGKKPPAPRKPKTAARPRPPDRAGTHSGRERPPNLPAPRPGERQGRLL